MASDVPNAFVRKSSQEVEIDHLLAEEFLCDPTFAGRFAAACGNPCQEFRVRHAIAEPSLAGDGYGDLLVEGLANGSRAVLLIENKITAAPAVRQAERYASFAHRLRADGCDQVWTILVAPGSYQGERAAFNATLNLETLVELIEAAEPLRRTYRQGVIKRALGKKATTGVQVPDPQLHRLKSDYLRHAAEWCAGEGFSLRFPALKPSYYDGDAWIDPIHSPDLPSHVRLRHRLWISVAGQGGLVDLIMSPPGRGDLNAVASHAPPAALVTPFSKGKGVQVSLPVPQLRQADGFDPDASLRALQAMRSLVAWYLEHVPQRA